MSTVQQEELSYFLWKIQLVQFEWNELPLEKRRADDETTEVLKASRGSEVVAARLHCRQTGASTVASATAPAVVLTVVSAVVSARIAAVETTGYEEVGGRGSVHQSPTLNSVLETLQLMRRQCAQMLTATGEDQVKTAHFHGSIVVIVYDLQVGVEVEKQPQYGRIADSAGHVNWRISLSVCGVDVGSTSHKQLHVPDPFSCRCPMKRRSSLIVFRIDMDVSTAIQNPFQTTEVS